MPGCLRIGGIGGDSDADGRAASASENGSTPVVSAVVVDGADPAKGRAWLIAERRILTTAAGVERAPLELTGPVLRISPHVDTTLDDLTTFAEALTDATAAA